MLERSEEEPEPDPEIEPESEPPQEPRLGAPTPVVDSPPRTFEYRTERVAMVELSDGSTLAGLLSRESEAGWDLVELVRGEAEVVVLLRQAKRADPKIRPVGFTLPGR
ncbi:MAG TPA: hypothetical protein VNI34_02775 [Candidatus Nitrosotalea sp.]|nr:hypothetical protein [Candidatus Nitrosotalea sp.]